MQIEKNTYFNFASRGFYQKVENGTSEFLFTPLSTAYNRFSGENAFEKAKGKTAFAGDCLEIDGLKFDILLVCSDEENESCINDTSMVFRMTAEGQTVLFLGDSFIAQGNKLLEKYDLK